MPTVRFPSRTVAAAASPTVYLKELWGDEWEAVDFLHATQIVWAAAPEIPTATLRWNYGQILRPGSTAFAAQAALADRNRWYVKISQPVDAVESGEGEADPSSDPLEWYGILEVDARDLWGTEAGDQTFTAFGLITLLDRHRIYRSVWLDDGSNEERIIERGITFNDVPESFTSTGNRSIDPGPTTYVFAQSRQNASYWSTRDIVDYLLRHATPIDDQGDRAIPFELVDDDNALPDWDHPILEQHGKTTLSLLNQLIARQRLLSYRVEVSGQTVQLIPFTFAGEDVDLSELQGVDAEILANPTQLIIGLDNDRTAALGLTFDSSDAFDKVIVRGARRRSVCSLCYNDSNLDDGWPVDLEAEYEAGASNSGDYPSAGLREKRQRRNAEARSAPRLRQVYSRFVPPLTWDMTASGGPVFPDDVNPDESYPVYPDQLCMLDHLPLLRGVDYSGTKIETGTTNEIDDGPFDEMTPLVLFPTAADPNRWTTIERYGEAGYSEHSNRNTASDFSGSVSVAPGDNGISIRIHGKPQHVIALSTFSPLDVDNIKPVADYLDAIFTVAFADDRYCQEQYPVQGFVGVVSDGIRVLDIDAGDKFRLDYCVPDTVVGVNFETGELIRSTSGGFIRDDRPQLYSLARLAYEWYAHIRKAITFRTRAITSALRVGDFVSQVNETHNVHEVNTIITKIEIDFPYSEGERPEPPTFSVQTGFASFDPLAAIPEGGQS